MSTGNFVDTVFFRYRTGHKETNAFLAVPSFPAPLPGIILAHDIYGLDEHTQNLAVELAKQGYTVLAPDFYSTRGAMGERGKNGPGPTSTFEQRRQLRLTTPDQWAVADINKGYEWLKNEGYADAGRVGLVGFGFGGTVTTLAAGQTMHFAAAVNYYGDVIYSKSMIGRAKPASPLDFVRFIQCPYLAFYGAPEEDISLQDLKALEGALRTHNVPHEIKHYTSVPNGFFNESRPEVFRVQAANESWGITTRFLAKYLKGEDQTSGTRPRGLSGVR